MRDQADDRVTGPVESELARLEAAGLRRRLRAFQPQGGAMVGWEARQLVNFSSNDYLGLAASEILQEAMIEGIRRYGAGAGASRLVCGTLTPHQELEEELARFKGTQAALAFSSGYATALGIIPALCGKDDVIILDKLSHASLIDAARLSGAAIRVFPHNHLEKLGRLLAGARSNGPASRRVLVVTESVFSMDGDEAPLREIVALKEHHGALLLVDEAHAVGLLGPCGRGLAAALGVESRVDLQMGTLSKAFGVSGGYVAASRALVDLFVNKARSLIYSTAPPPCLAHTAAAAVRLVEGGEGQLRRERLEAARQRLFEGLGLSHRRLPAAIVPLIIGGEHAAMQAAAALLESGFLVPAIRYPTVARGAARLRLTLSAAHETGQIESLVACLLDMVPELRAAGEHPL